VRALEKSQRAVVLRLDRRSALALKDHADFAEVVAIDQIGHGPGRVVIVAESRAQVVSLDMHRELAVADEVHEAFGALLLLVFFSLRVFPSFIFLLKVVNIGASKDTIQLDHELSDALVFFFLLEKLGASCWYISGQNGLAARVHVSFFDAEKNAVLPDEISEGFLGYLALVNGGNLVHKIGQLRL